jgi:hypothetical protein
VLVGAIGLALMAAACGEESSGSFASPDASTTSVAEHEHFTDPQGTYTLEINPAWEARHGAFVAEVEMWAVGPRADDFTPNVNVLTQTIPTTMNLAEYMDLTIENGDAIIPGLEVVESRTIPGPAGRDLGLLDYTGTGDDGQLHFLQVIDLLHDHAVVATLTTTAETFADYRPQAESFLVTLQAT